MYTLPNRIHLFQFPNADTIKSMAHSITNFLKCLKIPSLIHSAAAYPNLYPQIKASCLTFCLLKHVVVVHISAQQARYTSPLFYAVGGSSLTGP